MKSDHDIKLGDLVKDKITGFKGVCTGLFEYLNGCVRVSIQPEELKDGKPIESHVFDVEQVEVVKPAKHPMSSRSGGPCDAPATRSTPSRR